MEHSLVTGRAALDAAVVSAPFGTLLVLDEDGALIGLDLGSGAQTVLCRVDLPAVPEARSGWDSPVPRPRLHASADGAVAVVVVDAGTDGLVVETATGRTTLRITAEDYHARTVQQSVALLRHAGRDVVVHRTAWNRLDVADARTGALLTERGPTAWTDADAPRPAHYLDYFHGPLAVSPAGTRIADGGWVWQPVGVLRVWSPVAWLAENPWESEDGPSVEMLIWRDDWNLPMVWLDEDHLAVADLASWDDEELEEAGAAPGVRVMDVRETGRAGDLLIPTALMPEHLLADGSLLLTVDADGTCARDRATGEVVRTWPDLRATHLDRERRVLIEVRAAGIVVRPL